MQRLKPVRLICLVSVLLALGACSSAPLTHEEHLKRQVIFTVAERDEKFMTSSFAETGVDDETPPDVSTVINTITHAHRLREISRWTINSLGVKAVIAEIRSNARNLDDVVSELAEDERVETVQPVSTFDLLTYNDPYFDLQNASVRGADIEKIHDLATGKDVVVAVVDTGVDRQHPDLVDRIIMSRNFVEHDASRFDFDEHGTSVAGVIASTANNDLGIVGVAPDVKLMVFKSCWEDSQSRRARCDSYSIAKALVEVLRQQPDILNLSLAGPHDPLIERLLRQASDRGIIIVAAVDPRSDKSFPAGMPEVIAVSAPLPTRTRVPANALLAPGTDVLTTTPGATYAFRSGSSIATAYVSGIAALMKERQPTLSGEQVRTQLITTSRYSVDMIPVVDVCRAVFQGQEGCPLDVVAVARSRE